jgi:hypothetical protein
MNTATKYCLDCPLLWYDWDYIATYIHVDFLFRNMNTGLGLQFEVVSNTLLAFLRVETYTLVILIFLYLHK